VDGDASLHAADADGDTAAAVAALREKYPQYARTPLFHGEPTLLAVAVRRTTGWCAGTAALAGLGVGAVGGSGAAADAGGRPVGDAGTRSTEAGAVRRPGGR
jgi:hypothetical protein